MSSHLISISALFALVGLSACFPGGTGTTGDSATATDTTGDFIEKCDPSNPCNYYTVCDIRICGVVDPYPYSPNNNHEVADSSPGSKQGCECNEGYVWCEPNEESDLRCCDVDYVSLPEAEPTTACEEFNGDGETTTGGASETTTATTTGGGGSDSGGATGGSSSTTRGDDTTSEPPRK